MNGLMAQLAFLATDEGMTGKIFGLDLQIIFDALILALAVLFVVLFCVQSRAGLPPQAPGAHRIRPLHGSRGEEGSDGVQGGVRRPPEGRRRGG